MKKILALVLVVTLLGAMTASVFAAASTSPTSLTWEDPDTGATIEEFPDGTIIITTDDGSVTVTDIADHWGRDAIISVIAKKLMIGYPDKKFHPADGLSAAMVYTVIARLNDANIETTGDNWVANVAAWAEAEGIAIDVDPEALVTREQMVDIFAAAEAVEGDPVEWAVASGLLQGDATGDLMLDKDLTRAEFATVLVRYLGKAA